MMSKTLSNKQNAPLNIMLWTMRKNAIVTAIATIISLIIAPGVILEQYYRQYMYSNDTNIMTLFFQCTPFLTLITIALALILPTMNLKYMHSKKATDVFHSLPIKRSSLLFNRLLASTIMTFIPVVASVLVSIIIFSLGSFGEINIISILLYLLELILITLCCIVFTTLFAVSVGNVADMIISLAVVSIGWPLIIIILTDYSSSNLIGFSGGLQSEFCIYLLSPFGLVFNQIGSYNYHEYNSTQLLSNLPYYIIFTLVVLVAVFFSYRLRKSETASGPDSFPYINYMIKAISGFVAGIILSAIFGRIMDLSVSFCIFFTIGSVLGSVIIGLIIARGSDRLVKNIILGCIVSAVAISYFLIIDYGAFGYETRVPKLDSVKSVTIIDNNEYNNSMIYTPQGSYYSNVNDTFNITATEKDDIEDITRLHHSIIEYIEKNKDSISSYSYLGKNINGVDYYDIQSNSATQIALEYKLKGGGTLKREYGIYKSEFKEELSKIYSTKNLTENVVKVLDSTDFGLYDHLEISNYGSRNIMNREKDLEKLIEAYKSDIKGTDTSEYFSERVVTLTFIDFDGKNSTIPINVYHDYTETLKMLAELDLFHYTLTDNW